MRRKQPLVRKAPLRTKRRTKYRNRERDVEYMLWVKRQLCAATSLYVIPGLVGERSAALLCSGPVEADHTGRRGIGRKADDATCIPLCARHHRERTDFGGVFRTWDQTRMRLWLESVASATRARYEYEKRANGA